MKWKQGVIAAVALLVLCTQATVQAQARLIKKRSEPELTESQDGRSDIGGIQSDTDLDSQNPNDGNSERPNSPGEENPMSGASHGHGHPRHNRTHGHSGSHGHGEHHERGERHGHHGERHGHHGEHHGHHGEHHGHHGEHHGHHGERHGHHGEHRGHGGHHSHGRHRGGNEHHLEGEEPQRGVTEGYDQEGGDSNGEVTGNIGARRTERPSVETVSGADFVGTEDP